MNTKYIYSLIVVAVLIGGFLVLNGYRDMDAAVEPAIVPTEKSTVSDYKNATYTINGESIQLVNGVSEKETAPGSASKTITRYFGNAVNYDFDEDGREDVVFLLTQETGGSGTFYYVVAALNRVEGYRGSQALLLGDRIAPQTTEMGTGNVVIVNYAERAPGESFAVPPSVGKSLWLKLDTTTMQFGEVVQNFEGEADPSRMSLGMKTWKWISAQGSDNKVMVPKRADAFTLTFKDGGLFSATTDCNGVGGKYTVNNQKITFNEMMSTLMYCEESQEAEFNRLLSETESYHFTSKGELVFELKQNGGSALFR